jgi:ABC-type uncharacterized transport system involved in gliding motility auxiliary subunit
MRANRKSRYQLRLASTSFVILLLAVAGVLLWLSREYHAQFDWTHGARNTLSEASRNLLATLDQPVQVTAFARDTEGLRQQIGEFVGRYQKHKKDIALEIVNPDTDPARVRAANVRLDGEMVVTYNGRRENINQMSEEAFTNALARLGRGGERWVVFLGGHGERSPDRQANFDLSTWAAQLNKRGLKTKALALGGNTAIPQNTSVLVIAGPRVNLLGGEVKQIGKYLAGGGNLLWLAEPGPLHGLERVAESLGVELLRGTVVDPASQSITGTAGNFIVITRYGMHPAVQNFDLMTLFPEAAGLSVQPPTGWEQQTILDTAPTAWVEAGAPTGKIQFDAGKDVRGPVNLAVALTRKQEGREQRVVVVGDGDFLSNAYVGNGGNLDLGMNLVNWVASDDAYINVPARTAPDLNLTLSQTAQIVILLGFLVVVPLALLGSGLGIWWRRRKR